MSNLFQRQTQACVAVLFLMVPFVSQAETAVELTAFFQHQTMKARFTQEILGQRRQVQQTMHGRLVVERPGKFLWLYQSPYEQTIVADGQKIWLYDVDLEQITVKAQDQSLGGTPAMLLSNPDDLKKHFSILRIDRGDDVRWFELTPKDNDGTFEHLYLGLKEGVLSRLELQDSFGQLTLLMFDDVIVNDKIAADTFVFSIPAGVDVIDETVVQ